MSTQTSPFGPPFPWVFVDGEHVPEERARVSVHANALSYGTGTFEGIRATWSPQREQLHLLEAHAHFDRMQASARILGLPLPLSTAELVAASVELLRRNEVRCDAYLRPLWVLAAEQLPVRMHAMEPRLSIAATPVVGDYIDLAGVRCTVSSWRRTPDVVAPNRAKLCGTYVGCALAKSDAVAAGYDEAIMLNCAGNVAEATTSNVLMRSGGRWHTPAPTEDILEGITRAQVMELLAERTGRPVVERAIQRSELLACDELLLCGTASLVVPVVEVDGRRIGDGPGEATLAVLDELRAMARGDRDDRTTPVYE